MSYSLVFRKNGVEILSLGAGHPLSVAFLDKPYDEWEQMPKNAFSGAMHTLLRQDESFEDDMEIYNKMLEHSSEWEDKWEAVSRLHDIKKERQVLSKAKVMLEMLEMIWEEGKYSDDGDKSGLEWGVF